MSLFSYYSLDECSDNNKVIKLLKKLKKEGKIEYSIDNEIIKIVDIDLDETELSSIVSLFDDCDVFPYLEMDDNDDSLDYDNDGYDDNDDYDY